MSSSPGRTRSQVRGSTGDLVRLLGQQIGPYRSWVGAIVVFQIVGTLASLVLPAVNAEIIDEGIIPGDTQTILRLGAVMVVVSVIQIGANIIGVRYGALAAMSVGRDIRSRLFHHVSGFSSREVDRFGAPSLINRNTNDVQQVQMLAMTAFSMLVTAPIMFVGGVGLAIREEPGLAWLVAIIVPIMVLMAVTIVARMVPANQRLQTHLDEINQVLREQITGVRVVRAFVREPLEIDRFAQANDDLTDQSLRVGRWMALIFPGIMFVVNASSVAVLWFGGRMINAGDMDIGSLSAFLTYLSQILMATMMSTMSLTMIPRAAVSANRITDVLDEAPSVQPPPPDRAVTRVPPTGDGSDEKIAAGVEFDRVGFSYPGAAHPVLSDVSLTARPGTTTAIVGSTGAGKTTLINLIPRLFDVTDGEVRVAGEAVGDYALDTLWSQIGLVPQNAYLFSGTVASNLRFALGPDGEAPVDGTGVDDSVLWEALELAQAADFVAAMDGGLNAQIAQGGTNVSGGQRQRLAIARALIRRPSIYLFDDSFSALDVATDAQLRQAIEPVVADTTVITVAQRVSTIITADQIVVLEAGTVVGVGTHDELIAHCPTYREIVDSQMEAAL